MNNLKGVEEKEAKAWLAKAAEVARKSFCLNRKCGTVIVKDGELIGEGYNAPPLDDVSKRRCLVTYDFPQKPNFDRTCCVHAEWRAIIDALRRNPEKVKGSRLYFTGLDENDNLKKSGKPSCTVCSRMSLDVGIAEFVLWHEQGICVYPTDEYNELSYEYGRN